MEQEYSVGTTNRYAIFLDEEDDPGDVVVPSSAKPEKDASGKNSKEKGGSKQQGKGTKGKENKERIAKEQQSKKAAIENAAKGEGCTRSSALIFVYTVSRVCVDRL